MDEVLNPSLEADHHDRMPIEVDGRIFNSWSGARSTGAPWLSYNAHSYSVITRKQLTSISGLPTVISS